MPPPGANRSVRSVLPSKPRPGRAAQMSWRSELLSLCGGAGQLALLARGGVESRRLDPGRRAGAGDLDPPRLQRLGLRDAQGQHAVGDRGLDVVGVQALRDGEEPLEAAEPAL